MCYGRCSSCVQGLSRVLPALTLTVCCLLCCSHVAPPRPPSPFVTPVHVLDTLLFITQAIKPSKAERLGLRLESDSTTLPDLPPRFRLRRSLGDNFPDDTAGLN